MKKFTKYFYRLLLWLYYVIPAIGKHQSFEQYYSWNIKADYLYPDGCPKRCFKCGSKEFRHDNYDYLDGHTILEYDAVCKGCGYVVGHWAYGYWRV